MTIASVLARKGGRVITIRPEQSIRQALGLLAGHNIGALVVVTETGAAVGIVSERDVVRAAVKDERIFDRTVEAIMTRDVIVAVPQDDLAAVAHTMTERRIRHLPVLDGTRLVGIVSIGDVVKTQRDSYAGQVQTLEMQIQEGPP